MSYARKNDGDFNQLPIDVTQYLLTFFSVQSLIELAKTNKNFSCLSSMILDHRVYYAIAVDLQFITQKKTEKDGISVDDNFIFHPVIEDCRTVLNKSKNLIFFKDINKAKEMAESNIIGWKIQNVRTEKTRRLNGLFSNSHSRFKSNGFVPSANYTIEFVKISKWVYREPLAIKIAYEPNEQDYKILGVERNNKSSSCAIL